MENTIREIIAKANNARHIITPRVTEAECSVVDVLLSDIAELAKTLKIESAKSDSYKALQAHDELWRKNADLNNKYDKLRENMIALIGRMVNIEDKLEKTTQDYNHKYYGGNNE